MTFVQIHYFQPGKHFLVAIGLEVKHLSVFSIIPSRLFAHFSDPKQMLTDISKLRKKNF